ncbi:hypothetical protein NL676_033141 [Syzygium grande]|nr:hypothetical protein NL676_033141 [Syzygium grande]
MNCRFLRTVTCTGNGHPRSRSNVDKCCRSFMDYSQRAKPRHLIASLSLFILLDNHPLKNNPLNSQPLSLSLWRAILEGDCIL